jgi:hypothetical protein
VPGWHSLYGKSHQLPIGMIWLFAILASLPWSLVLFRRRFRQKFISFNQQSASTWRAYLLCWLLAPLICFTPARNIMFTYVLPAMPAFAILLGLALWPEPVTGLTEGEPQADLSRAWILVVSGLVPIAYLLASFLFMPTIALRTSESKVIEWFRQADAHKQAELVYYGDMPDSAFIYGGDVAKGLDDQSTATLARLLSRGGQKYFVIRKFDQERFLNRITTSTVEVSRIGKYVIRRTSGESHSSI